MKLYIKILVLLLCSTSTFAQNNCINEVSTNPENPTNSTLPNTNINNNQVNDDQRFLNQFNWYDEVNVPLQNMLNEYPSLMTHFTNMPDPYYNYIDDGPKLTPENGWELMSMNLGYFPDLTDNPFELSSPDLPYIVLYNRFTGILRVFGTYGISPIVNSMTFDGIKINLRIPSENKNGLLRLTAGKDKSLDQTTDITLATSMTLHPNSPRWFSADFQIAYDPCVCYYPSDIQLTFEFLQEMEMDILARSITITEENIADGSSLATEDFFTNFSHPGTNETFDEQIVMYKVMEDLIDDYIERMEVYDSTLAAVNEHNKKVKRNIVVAKIAKNILVSGLTAGVTSLVGMSWFGDVVTWASDLVPIANIASDSDALKKYGKKVTEEFKKILGKQADAFISKNFEEQETPEKPKAPTASFTETRMKGTIRNFHTISVPEIYTPGSYGSEGTGTPTVPKALEYPIYNEALGNFALLNTPKINAFKTTDSLNFFASYYEIDDDPFILLPWGLWEQVAEIGTNADHFFAAYQSWSSMYQFQLAEDVYYVLNDINIKSHDISIAFVIEAEVENYTNFPSNLYIDPYFTANLTSMEVETDEGYYPIVVSNGNGFNNGNNYCNQDLFGSSNSCQDIPLNLPKEQYSKDTLIFESEFYPIDAVKSNFYSIATVSDYYYQDQSQPESIIINNDFRGSRLNNFKIKMKIIVDVVYNDRDEKGENMTATNIFTYDISDIEWLDSIIESNVPVSPNNYDSYFENLSLDSTSFDGSEVDGCQLIGHNYICYGWDEVKIYGDISTTNGYSAEIYGGNLVRVMPEATVSPEIILGIKSPLDFSQPMSRTDGEFVRNFCLGEGDENFPSYSANIPSKRAIERMEAREEQERQNARELKLNIYPNPTSNYVNVKFSHPTDILNFKLHDLSGREVPVTYELLDREGAKVLFKGLQPGVYTLITETVNGSFTNKIVVDGARNN